MIKPITIVSGLPRSGTSLMMKMLDQGGMPVVTDHIRKADIDNPEGYYEFELVKKIKQDVSWLKDTRGNVFKMISMLLFDLPPTESYQIIFMERHLEEVLASQEKMLNRNKVKQDTDHKTMEKLFRAHLQKVCTWLKKQKNINILPIHFNQLLSSPENEIPKIIDFLNLSLDQEKMACVIDPELYRNKITHHLKKLEK